MSLHYRATFTNKITAGGGKYAVLSTRDKLGIDKIPPGMFVRPVTGLDPRVLRGEFKTVDFCTSQGQL